MFVCVCVCVMYDDGGGEKRCDIACMVSFV